MLTNVEIGMRVGETGRALTQLLDVLIERVEPAVQMLAGTLAQGGKVLVCGNGGSAAMSNHLVAELVVRFETDRKALPAISLASDAAILTAVGNDYAFERIFSRQIEALGTSNDALVAFSTSGKSKNIKEAIHAAHRQGMRTLGISGRKGMNAIVDCDMICPGESTAIIQEMHLIVVHVLCSAIERGIKS